MLSQCNGLVCGTYQPALSNEGGWGVLDISVNDDSVHSREDISSSYYSAGYLEGYLTCKNIQQFIFNSYTASFGFELPSDSSLTFLRDNFAWMRKSAANNPDSDYWFTISTILSQFDGMVDGIGAANCGDFSIVSSLSLTDYLLLNLAYCDLWDICVLYTDEAYLSNKRVFPNIDGYDTYFQKNLRCSSIFSLLPNEESKTFEVLFAHTTWDGYATSSPRIIKQFKMPVMIDDEVEIRNNIMSSSPGLLTASLDDFYVINSPSTELVVIETTLSVPNHHLYNADTINPSLMLCWARIMVANMLGTDGQSWSDAFGHLNSGTYNNQWQVLDVHRLREMNDAKNGEIDGIFTILEQIPGNITWNDESRHLFSEGYWSSYNVPYFPYISRISGNDKVCEAQGEDSSYCLDTCPRAQMFQEYHSTVVSMPTLQSMIEYNDWQYDPLSLGEASNAIASRGDLNEKMAQRWNGGAIDGKAGQTRSSGGKKFEGYSVSETALVTARLGQTHAQQPVFCWDEQEGIVDKIWMETPHLGHPQCFDYEWTVYA